MMSAMGDLAAGEQRLSSSATSEPRDLTSASEIWGLPGLDKWNRAGLIVGLQAQIGSITLHLPDGRCCRLKGTKPGPNPVIRFTNHAFAKRFLTGGNLGVAESFMDGDFTCDNLAELTEWAVSNGELDDTLMATPMRRLLRRVIFMLQANTRRGSKRNISYHYDLGNEFYARWLDPSMTYSSAIFAHPSEPLEAAQGNKYRRMTDLIGAHPDHEVLEIGAGWGGFACFAAKTVGCRVTGITISQEQYDYASRRVQQEGLAEKVTIKLCDYRDLQGRYDRIASIEMLEAVGERYWPQFFSKLRESLKPGGRAGLQVITIDDRYFESYRATMDFIQKYIFPGGMLPSPSALKAEIARAGLTWLEDAGYALHYAKTLDQWRDRFLDEWPAIRALGFDDRFRRMWEYYLAYCAGGFRAGCIDVKQLALAR